MKPFVLKRALVRSALMLAGALFPVKAANVEVAIRDFSFDPNPVTIQAGDTVTWKNQGGLTHTSTSDSGVWDSKSIAPGASFPFTFTSAGNFDYHCTPHPFMTGTIIVQAGQAQPPTITITAPANGASFTGETNLLIEVQTTAPGSSVEMVEFFDGGTFLDMSHETPFSIHSLFKAGSHTLTAKVTAANGQSAISAPVSFSVTSGGTKISNPYPPLAKGDTAIELQPVVTGLVSPLSLAAPDDGSGRLFVFDQVGVIYVVTEGAGPGEPLLDIRSRLVALNPAYDERGLLGVATHPNFAQNPFIYTYSSEPTSGDADFMIMDAAGTNNHQSVIAEWKIDPANTNRVDPASRREIMRIDEPQSNHNAGTMNFGADGMLYISVGDGGAADDQTLGHSEGGNGQDLNKILGKIIRIDVDTRNSANGKYGIPRDNPFFGGGGLPEIYAYGFRNPYRWSFDRLTGEMYVADVGQNDIEELDRVFKGGNYGWPIKEGSFYFDPNGTNAGFITTLPVREVPANLVDPIAEYDHSEGLAIVGGFVYHGTALPNLIGRYITGDFGSFGAPVGRLFYLNRTEFKELRLGLEDRPLGLVLKGFGQDQAGELYVFGSTNLGPSGTNGVMFRIVPVPNELALSVTSQSNAVTAAWSSGVGPFMLEDKEELESPFWNFVTATTNRTMTLETDEESQFWRISDTAGIRAVGFSVYMTAQAERPTTNSSTAIGTGTLQLEGNSLHFDIHYSGLTGPATAAHIHGRATAAQAAGVMINLASYNGSGFSTAGVLSGSVTVTPEQKAAILAGQTYVNIHTEANGGGEIRGQVAPMIFTADLDAYSERPVPVVGDGEGTALFMLTGNQLTFNVRYEKLPSPATLAHIHGPASEDQAAGVMVNLAPFNGGAFGISGDMGGTVTLQPDQLAALVDGLTYVNMHTTNHPAGEIRGQIRPHSSAVPLTASLSGAAERPTPFTDVTATGTGVFALEGNTLFFDVRYSGLSSNAVAGHIHGPAKASEAAGVLINLAPFNGGAFGSNGTLSGQIVLTDEHRAMILEGRTYVNLHTPAHGGGEIRGQIVPALMHADLLGASERPSAFQQTGRGRATLMLAGDKLTVSGTYTGLSAAATAAHIHGAGGTADAAGVMVDLKPVNAEGFSTNGAFSGTVSLTADQIAALVDGLTYMNIHTGTHQGGEIRGQIVR